MVLSLILNYSLSFDLIYIYYIPWKWWALRWLEYEQVLGKLCHFF